jgi:hypothetical protein
VQFLDAVQCVGFIDVSSTCSSSVGESPPAARTFIESSVERQERHRLPYRHDRLERERIAASKAAIGDYADLMA